ncbi:MAG: hypothetical protein FWE36_04310 [Erysipelotrichales bacterium]|nr:hypothetical protein [Erysipelotrichales bacterium]
MPIVLAGIGIYVAFSVFLIPIVLGIMMAKRYNLIMGLVSTVFFGYIMVFIIEFIDDSFIASINNSTENGLHEGITALGNAYSYFIDSIVRGFVDNMNFNFQFLYDFGPLIIISLVFLIILVPSGRLRAARIRRRRAG